MTKYIRRLTVHLTCNNLSWLYLPEGIRHWWHPGLNSQRKLTPGREGGCGTHETLNVSGSCVLVGDQSDTGVESTPAVMATTTFNRQIRYNTARSDYDLTSITTLMWGQYSFNNDNVRHTKAKCIHNIIILCYDSKQLGSPTNDHAGLLKQKTLTSMCRYNSRLQTQIHLTYHTWLMPVWQMVLATTQESKRNEEWLFVIINYCIPDTRSLCSETAALLFLCLLPYFIIVPYLFWRKSLKHLLRNLMEAIKLLPLGNPIRWRIPLLQKDDNLYWTSESTGNLGSLMRCVLLQLHCTFYFTTNLGVTSSVPTCDFY